MSEQAIGLFDSGIGGLSVFSELRKQLPHEEAIYFADTKHMPYGSRTTAELQRLVFAILDWLVLQEVKLVIMACNTSSAWTLDLARRHYSVPILGMIQPTVEALACSGEDSLGIIATEATVKSGKYPAELQCAGYAGQVTSQPCPRLASLIESGADQAELEAAVAEYLQPLKQAEVKRLVLACTHYPFASEHIAAYLGSGVELVDPAEHVIAEAKRLLATQGLLNPRSGNPEYHFYTSGSVQQFERRAALLLGEPVTARPAHFVCVGESLRVDA